MKRGVSIPNFGAYADPGVSVDLARATEREGWHGFFVWDHIVVADAVPVADPWVLLAAAAAVTETVALGPMVTALPRRRPWAVARQVTTLDHLSRGRVILGVGSGFPPDVEFGTFGEPTGDRERADRLDEALDILHGMWSGSSFSYTGRYFQVKETVFAPAPYQGRTVPIWVGAMWPNVRPLRRAARYVGAFPVKMDGSPWDSHEVADLVSVMRSLRDTAGYDIVIGGTFDHLQHHGHRLAAAGATWFLAGPGYEDTPDTVAAGLAVAAD